MFDVWCEGHRARVLLTAGSVVAVRNGPAGIVVIWRCPCGQVGAWRTGRRSHPGRLEAAPC